MELLSPLDDTFLFDAIFLFDVLQKVQFRCNPATIQYFAIIAQIITDSTNFIVQCQVL